jgi:putative transposase
MASLRGYGRTSGAAHRNGLHLVWCSKYRRPVLGGQVADRLRSLIQANCAERRWTVQLKGFTSRVLRAEFPHPHSRLQTLLSKSYLVASVGRVSEATIRRYIAERTPRPEKGKP